MINDYLFLPSDIVFVGDSNIHMDNLNDTNAIRLQSFGLHLHVSGSTHIHGLLLDLLITYENATLGYRLCLHEDL